MYVNFLYFKFCWFWLVVLRSFSIFCALDRLLELNFMWRMRFLLNCLWFFLFFLYLLTVLVTYKNMHYCFCGKLSVFVGFCLFFVNFCWYFVCFFVSFFFFAWPDFVCNPAFLGKNKQKKDTTRQLRGDNSIIARSWNVRDRAILSIFIARANYFFLIFIKFPQIILVF